MSEVLNADTPGQPERRLALIVEYDGTHYVGFQLQLDQPTIQGALEKALTAFTREQIRIRGASRTDSGAHAIGQVVDFLTRATYPVGNFPRALNYYLPPDIKVQAAFQVTSDFHSRINAESRIYRYRILNRTWPSPLGRHIHHWVREELDTDKMSRAAQHLVGVHDFRPLASGHPMEKSAVRRVMRWDVRREQDTVVIDCEANGFLKHQIRQANGILVEVGKGKWPSSIVKDTLDHRLPEGLVWPSLPAHGLCLMQVTYPASGNLDFWDKVKATDETD
jgi:tRNA pseudouridine38-40 synthase